MTAKSFTVIACAVLAAAIAPARAADSCDGMMHARETTYLWYARFVLDDVKAIPKNDPNAPFGAAMEALGRTYARTARFGDIIALRKLIGLGLFTASAAHAPPPEGTFKLICELARRAPQPGLTLDPLTCAVVAVDGARRNDGRNRALARQMIDLARTRLAGDQNGPAAQKLFDDLVPIVTACSAE
jgi:hypothetical protein